MDKLKNIHWGWWVGGGLLIAIIVAVIVSNNKKKAAAVAAASKAAATRPIDTTNAAGKPVQVAQGIPPLEDSSCVNGGNGGIVAPPANSSAAGLQLSVAGQFGGNPSIVAAPAFTPMGQ